jgi:cell division protein FtsW
MDLLKDLLKGDKVVWIIFLILCSISIIEVFSAASTLTYKSGDHWGPITQHCTYLMVGIVGMIITHKLPFRVIRTIGAFLYVVSFFMLILVLFTGQVNGASRWLTIGGIQFQPSELGKMAVVIMLAFVLSRYQEEGKGANKRAFAWALGVLMPITTLIAPENGSTALLLFGVGYLMMFICGIQWKQMAKLTVSVVVFITLAGGTLMLIPASKYSHLPMMHRVETWQNRVKGHAENKEAVPAAKYDIDKDAQVAHANIAIASSHLIGKGPGNSVQRDFLSQAFSDFIFAIVIEELGLVLGGLGVVVLYLWLLIRCCKIAQRCERDFPAFMVIGIGILLVSQAVLNMAVAVGLFPVTGQPLPLISKGGTSSIINCIYIGIILGVSRYNEEVHDHDEQERETAAEAKLYAATQVLLEHAKGLVSSEARSEEPTVDTEDEYGVMGSQDDHITGHYSGLPSVDDEDSHATGNEQRE